MVGGIGTAGVYLLGEMTGGRMSRLRGLRLVFLQLGRPGFVLHVKVTVVIMSKFLDSSIFFINPEIPPNINGGVKK